MACLEKTSKTSERKATIVKHRFMEEGKNVKKKTRSSGDFVKDVILVVRVIFFGLQDVWIVWIAPMLRNLDRE